MAALAYHETVLPLGWQSIRGKEGPVTGAFEQALLARPATLSLRLPTRCRAGDAEYCNEPVITWLPQQHWDFVCHVRGNCLVRTTNDPKSAARRRIGGYQRSARLARCATRSKSASCKSIASRV